MRKKRLNELLEQFVVRHRGLQFHQVFLIFRIVPGDVNSSMTSSWYKNSGWSPAFADTIVTPGTLRNRLAKMRILISSCWR